MNKLQTFQEFLATQGLRIPLFEFVINLLLAAVFAFILRSIYIYYGTSLSNRRMFANNFSLITMTTMLVISIIKSSLALSLGLVGALSIVRFRAAIKEPEELAYLFLAIGLGLGFGAEQRAITIIAFAIICGFIVFNRRRHTLEASQNLYLTVSSSNKQKALLEQIVEILNKRCSFVSLKRFDETKDILEATFMVEFSSFKDLQTVKSDLQKIDESMKITFLDNRGII